MDGDGPLPALKLPERLYDEGPLDPPQAEPRTLLQLHPELLQTLSEAPAGKVFTFPGWLDFGSHACSVKLEKIFHSASNARLLHLQPGDRRVILKFTDLHQEAAIMAALRRMNECWRALDIRVCGQLVQTVTYGIDPLMDAAGLVEAVADCWNLRELAQESSQRHLRILQRLPDPTSQDLLAASTVAYLTSGYALGLR
ncbi:5-bisphosphate 3-kinase catalytic subunit gamma isoform, partial [Durusdinium trenchii]